MLRWKEKKLKKEKRKETIQWLSFLVHSFSFSAIESELRNSETAKRMSRFRQVIVFPVVRKRS